MNSGSAIADTLLPHIEPVVLVVARIGGLVLFAPVLSVEGMPRAAKGLLIFMCAVCVYPFAQSHALPAVHQDLATLGAAVLIEVLIGVTIGLFAMLPIYGTQLAGMLVDQQVGLGLGAVYNPLLDAEGSIIGDLYMYLAMTAFLLIGGLDALLLGVVRSFEHMPLGSASMISAPLPTLIALLSAGFELALRVSAPVLCIILLETVSTMFIVKTMPQINIMSTGFPIKVSLGMFAVVISLRSVNAAVGDGVAAGVDTMLAWCGAL